MKEKDLNENNQSNLKCIKENCKYYHNSSDYFESCELLSKYVLLDKCYGLSETQNKQENLACKISNLINELQYLNNLKSLIECHQNEC